MQYSLIQGKKKQKIEPNNFFNAKESSIVGSWVLESLLERKRISKNLEENSKELQKSFYECWKLKK